MLSAFLRTLFLSMLLFACTFSSISAQDKEWRPVTPAEVQQKTPKVEPDADAEAIFWEVRIDDSNLDLVMKHYVRVKVFTDKGREKYAKIDRQARPGDHRRGY